MCRAEQHTLRPSSVYIFLSVQQQPELQAVGLLLQPGPCWGNAAGRVPLLGYCAPSFSSDAANSTSLWGSGIFSHRLLILISAGSFTAGLSHRGQDKSSSAHLNQAMDAQKCKDCASYIIMARGGWLSESQTACVHGQSGSH